MKIASLFLAAFLLAAVSCTPKKKNSSTEATRKIDGYVQDIPTKMLPLRDSTNFDTFSFAHKLSEEQIAELKLRTRYKDAAGFAFNYKINLSDTYTALVICRQQGDFELFSTLITYDKDYAIIDALDIAYDEIAESLIRKESDLSATRIIVETITYEGDEPTVEKQTYTIQPNGKIKLMR